MISIIEISGVDPNSLRNSHNTLFLSLMDRLDYIKQQELEKEKSKSQAEARLSRKNTTKSLIKDPSKEMNIKVESEESFNERYKSGQADSIDLKRDSMDFYT